MKKNVLFLLILIVNVTVFADNAIDKKIGAFVNSLKEGEYGEGIENLLKKTTLADQVLNVPQTKTNWINQFTQIRSLYGEYLGYEKVREIKLGKMNETTYFVYCEYYPVQIIITSYDNGATVDIINMVYDDKVIETLQMYGERQ